MAHTRSRKRRARRALRREVPSIVPVLADGAHFARMRSYGSFAFDDHGSYLRQLEGLLRALTAQQIHARVVLFDPVDYELFCQAEKLDPDTPDSRVRYVAEIAAAGTTMPYRGQPVERLLPQLREAHACRLTWQTGTEILARAGTCERCGTDIGKAAFDRAAQALALVLETAGGGTHHLVGSVAVPGASLVTALDVRRTPQGELHAQESAALALTTALAAGFATAGAGGLVLRTDAGPGGATAGSEGTGDDVVRGWALDQARCWLRPLTASEVFSAYCTDPATREPLAPEPGVDHAPGFALPHPGGGLHC
ncbi:hypothetical protein ACFPA8_21345 [Streptomyces ovatisporus]|uniref:Uncharacterized protein n=1 Tax=Streptomyces ovatisporus TaxID=1128682 RepID=A0ABV9ACH3_9ACTN